MEGRVSSVSSASNAERVEGKAGDDDGEEMEGNVGESMWQDAEGERERKFWSDPGDQVLSSIEGVRAEGVGARERGCIEEICGNRKGGEAAEEWVRSWSKSGRVTKSQRG
jgi:hypothetical protein